MVITVRTIANVIHGSIHHPDEDALNTSRQHEFKQNMNNMQLLPATKVYHNYMVT